MTTIEKMANELEREAATTRKLLERLPNDRWDYKPHPKSFGLGQLASHIVDSFGWAVVTMQTDDWVMDPKEYKPFVGSDRDAVLAGFDRNVANALQALRSGSDASLEKNWTMKSPEGKVWIQNSREHILRDFVISHLIHHRGQLTVYLRLLDVPLPQVYGPTADETGM